MTADRESHDSTAPDGGDPLADKLRSLPEAPGVYLMKDARGKVVYVGKAARLSQRVRNYFGSTQNLDRKTRTLVAKIADFDWIVVPSEGDALILEDQLVKEYKPRYNIRLKDDKRYPYLCLTTAEAFPRIYVTRRTRADGNEYYGPYTSASAMRLTLKTLTSILPIRTCTLDLPEETVPRPCLDYHIDRCCAPCVDYVNQPQYRELVDEVRLFLQGRSDHLTRALRERMEAASEELRFEDAARFRDRMEAVEKVVRKQRVVMKPDTRVDVLALEREGREACGIVLRVRDGKITQTEDYAFSSRLDDSDDDFFRRFASDALTRSSHLARTSCSSARSRTPRSGKRCCANGTVIAWNSSSRNAAIGPSSCAWPERTRVSSCASAWRAPNRSAHATRTTRPKCSTSRNVSNCRSLRTRSSAST